ncbi:MAG: preprotein translocase subunit SecG [Aquificae bacterium]|nr:preprotein translocase subunit SecG [Aquificota bacterium]
MYYALLTLFIVVALLLILVTLMQKGRSDVGAAFGSGVGQSIFGVGGVDTILTKATYWLGALFLGLALLLSVVPKEEGSVVGKLDERKAAPQQPARGAEKGC